MTENPGTATVERHRFADDGDIPNNPVLALLVYRGVLDLTGDAAAGCEAMFGRHGWGDGWRNGVYPYHHYHSTAHEVLGIVRGEARVRFGGEGGETVGIRAGDVIVIPAGIGHKSEGASDDLLVIGAYPAGTQPDICRAGSGDRQKALANIPLVPVPGADPVFGENGPLVEAWRAR